MSTTIPQLASLSSLVLKVCCVNSELRDDSIKTRVLQEEYQLVLFTPEMLLNNRVWQKMLTTDVYSKRMRAFVIDEAHTVKNWYVYHCANVQFTQFILYYVRESHSEKSYCI